MAVLFLSGEGQEYHKDSGDPICFHQLCSSGALDTQIYILRSGMELETDNKPKLNYVAFVLS